MLHKNIPNNNKDIIRFLAKNFAGTKKVRNAILFCSVVIGIVAITMVFGISVGKIQAEEIRLIREWNCFFGQNRRWNRRTICKIKTTGLYKTGWEKHFCR